MKKLDAFGVNIDNVIRDTDGARNCLAITEILSPAKSGSVLYRDQVADLNLTYSDISESYLAQSKLLLVSGTALSRSPSREAAFLAAYYARKHNVAVALDIDHRPYTWELCRGVRPLLPDVLRKVRHHHRKFRGV